MPVFTSSVFFRMDIKRRGTPFNLMMKKVRATSEGIDRDLELLAVRTSKKMGQIIDLNRKRRSAHTRANTGLAGYFRKGTGIVVSRSGLSVTARVGNKNELNALFPYWKVINKGGKPPPANLGYFGKFQRPKSGGGGQVWHGGATGGSPWANKYFIQPKKPIPAMNYIGKTRAWLNIYWKSVMLKKIFGKLK